MEGDGNGQNGDDEGINEKRDKTGAFGDIRFDVGLHDFFDNFIPGEGGN